MPFSEKDAAIAAKYRLACLGRPDNVGIQGGMNWVLEHLTSKHILYLENDLPLTVDTATAVSELARKVDLLESRQIDIMRMRSRFDPGEKFHAVQKYTQFFTPAKIDPGFKDFSRIMFFRASLSIVILRVE